jgi:hypothetical protein
VKTLSPSFAYPYEEFSGHIKAMKTVRDWEYTSRFGHLGTAQTSRASSARVLEYFSDCYEDQKEAVRKAELFLSIHDYIGRNAEVFAKKDLLEQVDGGKFLVEPSLLRAVHHAFSISAHAAMIEPRKIMTLAKAFEEIETAS